MIWSFHRFYSRWSRELLISTRAVLAPVFQKRPQHFQNVFLHFPPLHPYTPCLHHTGDQGIVRVRYINMYKQIDFPNKIGFSMYTIIWYIVRVYGNASTRNRTQKWVWVRFLLFSRVIGNPSNTEKCWGISEYFGLVSAIFTFNSFPGFFWVRFLFFLGQFPVFKKSFKFSVCWSVSFFIRSVSSFFGSVSGFQKKILILSLLIGFLF